MSGTDENFEDAPVSEQLKELAREIDEQHERNMAALKSQYDKAVAKMTEIHDSARVALGLPVKPSPTPRVVVPTEPMLPTQVHGGFSENCPTCDSTDPATHIDAVAGEFKVCPDPYHSSTHKGREMMNKLVGHAYYDQARNWPTEESSARGHRNGCQGCDHAPEEFPPCWTGEQVSEEYARLRALVTGEETS